MSKHISTLCISVFVLGALYGQSWRGGTGMARARVSPEQHRGVLSRVLSLPTRAVPAFVSQVVPWGIPTARLHTIPAAALDQVAAVAVGDHHALALTAPGVVIGWGTNTVGELTIPPVLTDVVDISVGKSHSVALKSDGTVVSWGNPAVRATLTEPLTDILQMASGAEHTVFLRSAGSPNIAVMGDTPLRTYPALMSGKTIVQVAAGDTSSLALDQDGVVYRWGDDSYIPTDARTTIRRISARGSLFAAQRDDGNVVVWGAVAGIDWGTLAVTHSIGDSPDVQVYTLPVQNGVLQSLDVADWGIALRYGTDAPAFYLFTGGSFPSDIPTDTLTLGMHPSHAAGLALVATVPLETPTATTPRGHLPLPVSTNNTPGSVVVWGGTPAVQVIPSAATDIVNIAAGAAHIVAVRSGGTVVTWGENTYGQTTLPASIASGLTPSSPLRIIEVAAGDRHSLALRADGTVVAWGDNRNGQATVPSGLSDVLHISAGNGHSVALKRNGTIVAWGDDTYGQLNTPLTGGFVKIAAAGGHTVALNRTGAVVAWGRNHVGQATIPTGTYSDIAAGAFHTVLTDGDGSFTIIGDTSFDEHILPDESLQLVAAGSYFLSAITPAGQLVSWGLDNADQSAIPTYSGRAYALTAGSNFTAALIEPTEATVRASVTVTRTPGNDSSVSLPSSAWTGLIARFPMHLKAPIRTFISSNPTAPAAYLCPSELQCPDVLNDPERGSVAAFDALAGSELVSPAPVNLATSSFTLGFWAKRESLDRDETVFSLGAVQTSGQLLSFGFDAEGHVQCEFFDDNLVTAPWYVDTRWHHYSCSYDRATSTRRITRDGTVVAEDRARVPFVGVGRLSIGRRPDRSSGFNGLLDQFVVYNRALSIAELRTPGSLPSSGISAALGFDEVSIAAEKPANTQLLCKAGISCPATSFVGNTTRLALAFDNTTTPLTMSETYTLKPFTIALWAKSSTTGRQILVAHGSGSSAITVGFTADNRAFCAFGANQTQSAVLDSGGHGITCTFDGKTRTLGVDGVFTSTAATLAGTGAGSTVVAPRPVTGTVAFQGYIDDLTFYRTALTRTQLIDILNTSAVPPQPQIPTLTLTRTTRASASRTRTLTGTPTPSRTPNGYGSTKTPLQPTTSPTPATAPSYTRTRTPITTPTVSRTSSTTPTPTNTVVTATMTSTNTRTQTASRTPLFLTRTALARRTRTIAYQTSVVETAWPFTATHYARSTATAAAHTATVAARETLTAYPVPGSETPTPSPYPIP